MNYEDMLNRQWREEDNEGFPPDTIKIIEGEIIYG